MIKDVLVILDDVGERAGPFATSLAKSFGAHVTALGVATESAFETLAQTETRYDMVVAVREEIGEQVAVVEAHFVEQAERADLVADTHTLSGWVVDVEDKMVGFARLRDLAIIEQREAGRPKPTDRFIERLLLQTGRPTLIVPYIHDKPANIGHVTVAWDGSAVAARALADAMPFLQQADRVEVLSVETGSVPSDKDRDANVVRHLSRHGVDATARSVSLGGSVAETLLSRVADNGSDLLVMGAYGHSRTREVILGGASRDILGTMTVPVLMSH